jgi:hypothetical protein
MLESWCCKCAEMDCSLEVDDGGLSFIERLSEILHFERIAGQSNSSAVHLAHRACISVAKRRELDVK